MKLLEAIEQSTKARTTNGDSFRVRLAVGFTPLSLQTFLEAHLGTLLPARRIAVEGGDFDDLLGTINREAAVALNGLLCAVEWADFDPRLGARSAAPHSIAVLDQIVEYAAHRARTIADAIAGSSIAGKVVSPPTLPLPPIFPSRNATLSRWEAQLYAIRSEFAARLASNSVEVLSDNAMAERSPVTRRWSLKGDFDFGFPYTVRHAECVAAALSEALVPPDRRKGLLLDLDNTLWSGIIGDDGVSGVSWDLASGTQHHALFQRLVDLLAETGTFVGVVSKNDPEVAEAGLARADLLISRERIFPVMAGWGPKSTSIAEVGKVWNVGLDSLVFIDDSAVERGEVADAAIGVEILEFPTTDVDALPFLLGRMRDLFGSSKLSDEDFLRLQSVRANALLVSQLQPSGALREDFLAGLDATVGVGQRTIAEGQRALQLINKTNQFNLNGRRWDAGEVADFLSSGGRLIAVDYADRFGRLGEISALLVREIGRTLEIHAWVLSCRAFSRQIEYQTLRALLRHFQPETVRLLAKGTGRNSALFRMMSVLGGTDVGAKVVDAEYVTPAETLIHTLPTEYGSLLLTLGYPSGR